MVRILDSHVHLYGAEHLHILSWMEPSHPLNGEHSIREYARATSTPQAQVTPVGSQNTPNLRTLEQEDGDDVLGCIFVEVDQINNPPHDESGWEYPIKEYNFVASMTLQHNVDHTLHGKLVLGIIPWAPVAFGASAIENYERLLHSLHPGRNGRPDKVVGFRYLLRSRQPRQMLKPELIESLRWMGKRGYVFECTIDCAGRGIWQFDEVVEMIRRAQHDVKNPEEKVGIVISMRSPLALSEIAGCCTSVRR
ncbi:hypothetical protein AOQ84DRAFT_173506 [Glonium stellatum]|uniref:Amidohydrolase-related domain-containing protein n=1 Tax=Glonium stellatum TaxID=574774 RepID=A0A8E2JZ43_9PEZI|nr:hypothetical protein AOQ84DRAFT_173506 [Glonium stellatum]